MVQGNIDKALDNITQCIINAADLAIPKTSSSSHKHRKPWWNKECQEAKRKKQKAWGTFRRYPTTDNYIAYKKSKAEARRVRRKSQRESWINYISSITPNTSSKELWKKVKSCMGLRTEQSISFVKYNGQTITSVKNIADSIGQSLATISNANAYPEPFCSFKKTAERSRINFNSNDSYSYNCPFTEQELLHTLKSTRLSSPGPDGISYIMLKHLSSISLSNILKFFNRIWTEGIFPAAWQRAIVIPIQKAGKDPTDPKNYRPIALTSSLCKFLEKMVNSRLVYVLESRRLIAPFQSGFRRGRSTNDNLLDLETRIRNCFLKRKHLVSVFFDIEKAYDRTWRHGILLDLFKLDFRGNLPIFIQNFLAFRTFQIRIGNVLSNFYIQDEGVPQGSVLSVTLFSIKINDILKQLPPSVSGNLYVDDLHIACEGQDMRFIERQLQNAINSLLKWTNQNGFNFSIDKSSCVHFCRRRGLHLDPEIFIGSTKIAVVDSARLLGVYFDKKLTFNNHVLQLRTKCEKALNILKVLSCTSWGADRTSLLRIYRATIRSKMDYACPTYRSARKSVLKKLDTVHHSALRICCGAFRTSPVQSLYAECLEPSLNLTRDKLSLEFFYRIMSHPNHPLHSHLLNSDNDILYQNRPSSISSFRLQIKNLISGSTLDGMRVRNQCLFKIPPWNTPKIVSLTPFKGFDKSNTDSTIYKNLFCSHRQNYNHHIEVYTDGSKCRDVVGCGIVFKNKTFSYRLPSSFSVFSAELTAIEKALEHISKHPSRHFIIYTDSRSAVDALTSYSQNHPLINNILTFYNELDKRGFNISFCWVPGHVGICGNETSDAAAKKALNTLYCKIPLTDMKKEIHSFILNKWNDIWREEYNNKLHTIKPTLSKWPSNNSRKYDVVLTRLRIGHSRISHRHLLLGEPAPLCPHCYSSQLTIAHLLTGCMALRHLYRRYFNSSSPLLTSLIGEAPNGKLFIFLRNSGFYHNI